MFDSVEFHMIQVYKGGKRQDKDGKWIEGAVFEISKQPLNMNKMQQ